MPIIKQNADASAGLVGTDTNSDGEFVFVSMPYGPTTLSQSIVSHFSRRMIVKVAAVTVDTVASNAVTFQIWKVFGGVAPTSGTLIHSGTTNAQGTANTVQAFAINAGDISQGQRLVLVVSGALGAAGSGVVTVGLAPA